jgi:hypothetical protein
MDVFGLVVVLKEGGLAHTKPTGRSVVRIIYGQLNQIQGLF